MRKLTALLCFLSAPLLAQTTQIDANTQIKNLPYLNIRSFGASVTNADNSAAFAAAISQALSSGQGSVFVPPGTWLVCSSIVMPSKVHLYGVGRGDAGGPNTTIEACPTFAGAGLGILNPSSYVINFGVASGSTFGGQATDLSVNTNSIAGVSGIYMDVPEENSYLRNIGIHSLGAGAAGLFLLEPGNGGIFEEMYITAGAGANASTMGVVTFGGEGPTPLYRFTVDLSGYATEPATCVMVTGANVSILGSHTENCTVGVTAGNLLTTHAPFNEDGSTNLYIANSVLWGAAGGGSGTGIHVMASNGTFATPNANYLFSSNSYATGPGVVDDNFSSTDLSAFDYVGGYPGDLGGTSAYTRISFGSGNPWKLHNPITISKTNMPAGVPMITLADTNGSDNIRSLNAAFGASTQYSLSSNVGSPGGTTFQFQDFGLWIQDLTKTAKDSSGGGLRLWGNGFTHDAAFGGVCSGATSDGASREAWATSATCMDMEDGTFHFLTGNGLTPGATWSPSTDMLTISPTEVLFPVGFTSNGLITGNAGILSLVAPPATLPAQGAYLYWNQSVGLGETDFINSKGLGPGGFNWYNAATSAPGTLLMGLSPGGVLNTSSGFSAAGAAGLTTTITISACTMTFTGGILTGKSGC